MEKTNFDTDYIDRMIEGWFKVIENKLKNSFQAVKSDNEDIKKKLENLSNKLNKNGFDLKSIDIERIDKTIKEIKDNFSTKKETDSLKSLIEKKNQQKAEIKKEVIKELHDIFEKRIDKKFKKYSEKAKEVRRDVSSYKANSEKRIEELNNTFEIKNKEFLSNLEQERRNFNFAINQERAEAKKLVNQDRKSITNSFEKNKEQIIQNFNSEKENILEEFRNIERAVKKDSHNWKKYYSSRLDEDLKQRDEKIDLLERQIAYLKFRIKSLVKENINKKNKSELSKKGIFSRAVDYLADEDSSKEDNDSVKKVKPTKSEEKPVKPAGKGFLTKIIDSLSDN